MLEKYLKEDEIIDFSDPCIQTLAKELTNNCKNKEEVVKKCFEYVRDNINHSVDFQDKITTSKASDVLKYKTGWCYAKSHLLAALLRANHIPTGFSYQRFKDEDNPEKHYIHGLNIVFLEKYGWYKIDPRGNKEGINSQFTPPLEKLAFSLDEGEYDLPHIYEKPLSIVIETLEKYKTFDEMKYNVPDISFQIINYDEKYLRELIKLFINTIHNINKKDYSQSQLNVWANKNFDEESWKKRFSKTKPYICLLEDEVIAFCEYSKGYIDCFYVNYLYQNMGVGKFLLNHIINLAKNDKCTNLMLDSSITAKPFFEKFGFVELRKNLVNKSGEELINFTMELKL